MMISIVIPVFNTNPDDLEECLLSIEFQEVDEYEIVLVDDGSRKEIADYLDLNFAARKNVVIYHKKNEGVSIARNYGVQHAKGDYILFMDADDRLAPHALKNGQRLIRENRWDVVIGRICFTSRENIKEIENSCDERAEALNNDSLHDAYLAHIFDKRQLDWGINSEQKQFNFEGCWAHLVRKEIALKTPFQPGLKICEDTLWAVDLLLKNPGIQIGISYALWYFYIDNAYSTLNTFKPDLPDQVCQGIQQIDQRIQEQSDVVINAYAKWLFVKLKQIVLNYYLAQGCGLSLIQSIVSMKKLMHKDVFENMDFQRYFKRTSRIKYCVYRSGLIVAHYKYKLRK